MHKMIVYDAALVDFFLGYFGPPSPTLVTLPLERGRNAVVVNYKRAHLQKSCRRFLLSGQRGECWMVMSE